MKTNPLRILTTTIAALLALPAFAVIETWDGNLPNAGAGDSNISTGLNWADDTAPVSDILNTDLIFGGTTKLAPNFSTVFSLDSITFNNTSGAFTLGGSALTIGTTGIVNNDAQTQTLNNAITLGTAASTFNAASGGLTFGGTVTIGANTLDLAGGSAFSFAGITGTGVLNKTGAGTMTWADTGTNSFDFTIGAGQVNTTADASTDVFDSSASIAINGTGFLNLGESFTLDGAQLTRATGALLQIASGKTLTVQNGGDITITGAHSNGTASTVTVTGAGSTFTTTANLILGSGSTMNVLAGGTLSTGAGILTIGSASGATVTVDGTGSSTGAASLNLGTTGGTGLLTFSNSATGSFNAMNVASSATAGTSGTMTIQSGAAVTGTALNIANIASASTGTVTITGSGSTLTQTGASAVSIGAASASTGTFNVQSGGTFNSATGTTTVDTTGVVNITGGTYNANGNMTVNGQVNRDATGAFNLAASRTLTVQNGGDVNFTGAAYEHATASTVTVTGSGSTLSTNGSNQLRFRGGSTLNVLADADVSSGGALMLATTAAGGSATVLVDGAGSSLTGLSGNWGFGAAANVTFSNGAGGGVIGNLALANTSTAGTSANVNILSGSLLSADTLTVAANGGAVSGIVTVDASTLLLSSGGTIGSAFSTTATVNVNNGGVFNTGTGVLLVQNTGVIAIAGGTVNFQGDTTFDASDLTLTGAGSIFTVAAGRTLIFQNGADITVSGTILNYASGGNLTLTGAGTTLSGATFVGLNGGGVVNVNTGAAMSSLGDLDVVSGTLIVDGVDSSATSLAGISDWGQSGGTGTVTFRNGATGSVVALNIANNIGAGTVGTGNVQSDADLTLGQLTLGHATSNAAGTLTVTGSGSTATQTGASTLTIGGTAGTATLSLQSSGVFTTGTGAATVNATGTISIVTATLNANGNLTLNGGQLTRSSTGTFNLAAGKTLTVQNGGDATIIGNYTTAGAHYLVSGSGSTLSIGSTLSFTGGTSATANAGGLISSGTSMAIGSLPGPGETVTASGVGSAINNSGGTLTIGASGGNGALGLLSDATGSAVNLNLATSGAGTVGSLSLNSGADFTVTNTFNFGATNSAATATLLVDGAGSTFTHGTGTAFFGASAGSTANITIQNGGAYVGTTGTTTVGATGTVNLTGGSFTANGSLTLNGGQLTADATSSYQQIGGIFTVLAGGDATFANAPVFAASSSVIVTGAGSTFARTGNSAFDNQSVSVLAGGALSAVGFMDFADATTTSVLVDGTGSSLSTGSGTLSYWGLTGGTAVITFSNNSTGTLGNISLGAFTSGTDATLHITSGADVTATGFDIGNTGDTASGELNIGGAGSTLTVTSSDILLGFTSGGTGTINITTGGTLTMTSTGGNNLVLNSTGTVNLDGGSLILGDAIARNGGVLNFNSGLLSLDESLTIGAGGLIGENFTLDNTRTLIVGPTHTTTVDAFRTLTLDGGTLSTGALVNNGTLDFQRGTLAVTGAGGFNVGTGALGANVTLGTGANLSVTSTTVIASGATLRLNGGAFTTGGISNSGALRVDLGTAATTSFTNASGGRFFIGDTLSITATSFNNTFARVTLTGGTGLISGSAIFANNGGLLTGDGTIETTFNNNGGELRAEAGKTIYLTGAIGLNTGSFNLLGGTLDFSDIITNSAGGFISGRGALHTGGLTNNGVMAFSGGTTDIRGDVTNASGARIVTSGAGSTTTFFDDVTHNGIEIFTGAGASTVIFGASTGAGPFTGTGTVYSIGDLRPGNSPATVNYGGTLVLGNGTLTLEIGGLTRGTQYDSLSIANSFYADGILSLMLINGFAPALGNTFDLIDAPSINGTFDALTLPTLAQYLTWDTSDLYTTGTVEVTSTLTPIEQWRLLHFFSPDDSGDGADSNDFDGDGAQNLLEYGLGMDPKVPDVDGLPQLSVVTAGATQHIALTIVRPLSATDINYLFEVGGALPGFLPGSSYSAGGDVPSNANTTQVSRTDDGTFETITVRDNTPITGATGRFLRLKVTNP